MLPPRLQLTNLPSSTSDGDVKIVSTTKKSARYASNSNNEDFEEDEIA